MVVTKIELFGDNSAGQVMGFTVASGTAIPKGSVMVLSASPRTATIHASVGQKFVGVATAEKDALDSSTRLGVWTNGVFNFATSGAVADGDIVCLSATVNAVYTNNAETDITKIVGMAFGDYTGGHVDVRVLK